MLLLLLLLSLLILLLLWLVWLAGWLKVKEVGFDLFGWIALIALVSVSMRTW